MKDCHENEENRSLGLQSSETSIGNSKVMHLNPLASFKRDNNDKQNERLMKTNPLFKTLWEFIRDMERLNVE